MARHAIHRRLLLLVATDTKTHRVIHGALGYGRLGHVTVAGGAVNPCADVRGMIEPHVRRMLKTIDSLPRDVFASRLIRGQLFDFRLVGGDHLMARHAEIYAWNLSIRPLIHSYVAIDA